MLEECKFTHYHQKSLLILNKEVDLVTKHTFSSLFARLKTLAESLSTEPAALTGDDPLDAQKSLLSSEIGRLSEDLQQTALQRNQIKISLI